MASSFGDETMIRLSIEKGANVNSRDNDGTTPIAWAAFGGYESAVRLLLDNAADFDSPDNNGRTPLSVAGSMNCHRLLSGRCGHAAVSRLLLNAGADINSLDSLGRTPFLWACYSGHIGTLRLFIIQDIF